MWSLARPRSYASTGARLSGSPQYRHGLGWGEWLLKRKLRRRNAPGKINSCLLHKHYRYRHCSESHTSPRWGLSKPTSYSKEWAPKSYVMLLVYTCLKCIMEEKESSKGKKLPRQSWRCYESAAEIEMPWDTLRNSEWKNLLSTS